MNFSVPVPAPLETCNDFHPPPQYAAYLAGLDSVRLQEIHCTALAQQINGHIQSCAVRFCHANFQLCENYRGLS